MKQLPFSQACANNQDVIIEQLQVHFKDAQRVLELGSGTGQHAVYFAPRLAHLVWQPSDMQGNLATINAWLAAYPSENIASPKEYDIRYDKWPDMQADSFFSANAVHIMHWATVETLFKQLGLSNVRRLCLYGPFNYAKKFTSESNARFDVWLKDRDAGSGIRDFEAMDALAEAQNFKLCEDVAMPANNRLLLWLRNE